MPTRTGIQRRHNPSWPELEAVKSRRASLRGLSRSGSAICCSPPLRLNSRSAGTPLLAPTLLPALVVKHMCDVMPANPGCNSPVSAELKEVFYLQSCAPVAQATGPTVLFLQAGIRRLLRRHPAISPCSGYQIAWSIRFQRFKDMRPGRRDNKCNRPPPALPAPRLSRRGLFPA